MNNAISPNYFICSTDETITNVIERLSVKKGTNTYTYQEQVLLSVAIVEGRNRGLIQAFKAQAGFNWSMVAERNYTDYLNA
jgi:hypothetical protein